MTLQELKYVLAIAEYQNITHAAEHLFVSQSALSKYIKTLENQLNIKLFIYHDKKMIPTAAGLHYIEAAQSMMDIYQSMMHDIAAPDHLLKGVLHLGITMFGGAYILPRILPKFREMFPNVKVILHEEYANVLDQMLLHGDIDIMIISHSHPHPDIEYLTLVKKNILFAVNHQHPMIKHACFREDLPYPVIDLHHFMHDRFLLFTPKQRIRKITDQVLKNTQITPERTLVSGNPEAIQSLCEANVGVGFIPELYISSDIQTNVALFCVDDPSCIYSLVAAYRKNGYISKYSKRFIQLLQEEFSSTT